MILRFSEGCLTNTTRLSPSHITQRSLKAGTKGGDIFLPNPFWHFFLRLYWGKSHIVKTVGLISRYPGRGFHWAFIMVTNEVFLA